MTGNILLLLVCFGSYLHGRAEKVFLLDTLNATSELGWKAHSSLDEKEGWLEETYRSDTENVNHQAYSTCNMEHTDIENWLLLPRIDRHGANRLYVETKFTMRKCAEVPSARKTCKETLRLYATQVAENRRLAGRWWSDAQWDLVDTIAPNTETDAVYVQTSSLSVNSSSVYFALKDSGACTSILYVKIYHVMCPESGNSFVYLPRTLTGREAHSVVTVQGKCAVNASTSSATTPTAICKADGSWQMIGAAECDCNHGFVPTMAANSCTACPAGSYKPMRGFGQCRPCPDHSASYAAGSGECKCDPGFFRAKNESADHPCTQPPSKPSAVRIMTANQTSVTVGWQEPSSLGGRKEIWYSYKCPQCPHTVVADPPRKYFEAPYLVLSNLEPGTRYTVMIFALNEVSPLSDMKQYEVLEFKTEDSDNAGLSGVRVDAETENGVTIAWDSLSGVTDYELEKWEQNMTTMNVRTDQPYYSFGALDARRIYGFRVRAWSRRQSVTSWSDPLFYQVGTGQVSKDVASRAGLFIGRSVATSAEGIGGGRSNHTKWDGDMTWRVMLGFFFVVTLVGGILWFAYRHCRASRKQMSDCDVLDSDYTKDTIVDYGQYPNCGLFRNKMHGPLITNTQHQYGTQRLANAAARNAMMREKEYVDPATYQDPTQAVSEFAREIPPGSVVTSQPLDSGEFGEVFYGRFVTEDAYGRPMEALVAVKTLKADQQHNKNDFLMEAARMGQFNNRNVIRLIGVVTQSDPVMIVTELMVNKSLDKYLRDNQEQIGLTQVVRMIKGIANGMCYLHSKNFIHRDLAARNVLVNDKLECKISDFGLSRQLRLDDVYGTEPIYNTRGGKVPIRWTAPEALSQNTYTKASDVWSFGIVMWECTTFGDRPYWEWENQVVIQQVTSGYRLPCPTLLGDNAHPLYRLMQQCWQMERSSRPTFAQLYSDLQALESQLTAEDCGVVTYESPIYMEESSVGCMTPTFFHPPSPPASAPPVLSLQDFLEHNGIGHCFTNLNARGIGTVMRLMHYSYSDLRSLGLREEDANRICEALRLQGFTPGLPDDGSRTTRPRFQRPPPLPPMPYFPPVTLRRQQALSSLPPTPGGLVSSSGVSSGSSAGTGRGNQRSPLLSTSSVGTTQTILTSATPSGSCNAMTRRSMNLSTEEGFFV